MTIYQRRKTQPMKWLLAIMVFCLAMGWAMSDVYGTDVEQNPSQGTGNGVSDGTQRAGQEHAPTSTDPSPVPEPSTLALLALGLGGGALLLKRKKS